MPTKCCLRQAPFIVDSESTIEVAVGEKFNLYHDTYNCGDEYGYIYAWIKEDDTIIADAKETCLPGDGYYSCALATELDWVMPDKTVKIHAIGKHAGPPDWIVTTDYDLWWELKPAPTTCGQSVKVVDGDGKAVPYAIVYAYDSCDDIFDSIEVDGKGEGSLVLGIGDSYVLQAYKDGYTDSPEITVASACESEKTLVLTETPCTCTSWVDQGCISETHRRYTRTCTPSGCDTESKDVADASCATIPILCDQLVKVVNPALEPIESATVLIDMKTYSILCEKPDGSGWGTDADGFCYLRNLDIDNIYIACASKEGYEHYGEDGCKLFTACSPIAVILTLYKLCEQGFLVSDQDNNPIEDATVTVTGGATCTTDKNGCCSISLDADLYYDAEATKDGYVCYGSECRQENFKCVPYSSLPLKLQEVVACEYTGHASDAKIDHDDVPSSAAEGSEVTATVSVDCVEVGETRYRVKWILDGGTPAYSNDFLLGYIGEQDVSFTFTMPDHDVTMVAEVERCNASSEWEPCEHADHIKTYTITLTLYEGPHGVIAEGYPIPKCTGACPNENPCVADEGDELSFKVKIKNAGNESGMIRAAFVYDNLIRCEVHENLDAGETSEEKTLCVNQFWMLDGDISFQIQTSHRTQLLPEVIWETDETYDFMYCYTQTSTEGYTAELNPLPEEIHVGEEIKFEGKLSNEQGKSVENKEITIWEHDVFFDDEVTSGTTKPDGSFSIPWTVRKMEGFDIWGDEEAEFRAYYLKGEGDLEAKSNLQKTIIKGRNLTMAMVYGGIAVGLYVAGVFVPKVGKLVQVGALVPGGLAGYEIYLWAKDKIPFVSTELEQLALPAELREPLQRKKKVLVE